MSDRDYAILWVEGVVRKQLSSQTGAVLGGNAITNTPQHKLDGIEHLAADDGTRLDASTSAHGLMPKGDGDATHVYRGDLTQAALDADEITYDNATSGLTATDVQAAIDEIDATVDGLSSPSLALDDLSDVATSGAADNDVLTYDSGTSTWGPAAGGSGSFSGDASDVPASSTGYDNSDGTDVQAILDDFDVAISSAGGGGGSGSWPPLDQYALDGTFGDHFTGASLDAKWTRRNFTAGAEAYQAGKGATYLRISMSGRAAGDGYFQAATADGTYGMKFIPRFLGNISTFAFGVALLDSNGSGVSLVLYNNPSGFLLLSATTYSSYGGTFKGVGGNANPILAANTPLVDSRPIWLYVRKSGSSSFASFSLDGEAWSNESDALSWSGTLAKAGMLLGPLGSVNGMSTVIVDVDWFNKFTP